MAAASGGAGAAAGAAGAGGGAGALSGGGGWLGGAGRKASGAARLARSATERLGRLHAYAQAVDDLVRARQRAAAVHPSAGASTLASEDWRRHRTSAPLGGAAARGERFVLLPSEDSFTIGTNEEVGAWLFGAAVNEAICGAIRRKSSGTAFLLVWLSGALLTPALLVCSSAALLAVVLTFVTVSHSFLMLQVNRALLWRLMAEFDCWYAIGNSLLGAAALEVMLLSAADADNVSRLFVPFLLFWYELLYIIWDTFPVGFRTKLSKFMYVGLTTVTMSGIIVAFHRKLGVELDIHATMFGGEALMRYYMSLLSTTFQVSVISTRLYFLGKHSAGAGAEAGAGEGAAEGAASAGGKAVEFYFIRSAMRLSPLALQAQMVLAHRRPDDPVARHAELRSRTAGPRRGGPAQEPAPAPAPSAQPKAEEEQSMPRKSEAESEREASLINFAYADAQPERFRYEEALWPSVANASVRHQRTLWLVWAVAAFLNLASLAWGRALGLWAQIPLMLVMWPAPIALIATINKRLLKLLLLEFEGLFMLFQVLFIAALLIKVMHSSFDAVGVIIVLPTVIAGVLCDAVDPRVRRQTGLLISSCSFVGAVGLLVGIVGGAWRMSSEPVVLLGYNVDPTAALEASMVTAIVFFAKTIFGLLRNKENLAVIKSKIVTTKVTAAMAEQLHATTVDAVQDAINKFEREVRAPAAIAPSLSSPISAGQPGAAEPQQGQEPSLNAVHPST